MYSLPILPDTAALLSPYDVEAEMRAEIAKLKAKKITPEEFENALRAIVSMKTLGENPNDVLILVKEIHHGSPHVPKPSVVKFTIPANNRVPLIFPPGYDVTLSKDMSADVGGTDNGHM